MYLRNITFSRAVGLSGGVPITFLISIKTDTSKFRVFGCIIFATTCLINCVASWARKRPEA
jgi:hypothetical protein